MKYMNVFTKKVIPTKGEATTLWHKVGLIKQTKSGHWYLQLFHVPDTDYYVYEHEESKNLPTIQLETEEE